MFVCALQDLRETLEQELDFINEGRNSERCSKELSKFSFVYVPRVFWNLTTKVFCDHSYCYDTLDFQ
jgi:aarF domain-containing kinase